MKVSGLNTEYFTFTWLSTLMAVDDWLFRWVMGLLRMGHFFFHHGKQVFFVVEAARIS